MPYLQLSIPSGTKIGDTVKAASGTRVTPLAHDQLRITDAGGRENVCTILSAVSENGRTTMLIHQPVRPSDDPKAGSARFDALD